ncbi:hypothetical protein ABT47_12740 [Shewanella xiamenensis]|nr:hypothetical protein ABT47_12740 [Shewanella xiamenensis]
MPQNHLGLHQAFALDAKSIGVNKVWRLTRLKCLKNTPSNRAGRSDYRQVIGDKSLSIQA